MDIRDIPTDDPAFLVGLLAEAQIVMANLVSMVAFLAHAPAQGEFEGMTACRRAARLISAGQREQADIKRRANQVAEAQVIDEARERFESMIEEALGGARPRH